MATGPICWMTRILMLFMVLMMVRLLVLVLTMMMHGGCERMTACVPVAMARARSASTLCY